MGIELEPFCGRLSPQAKSRAQRGTSYKPNVQEFLEARVGIEPETTIEKT